MFYLAEIDDYVDGMQFDKGFLSPHFVTDVESQVVELEDPFILINTGKISAVQDLVPILEKVSELSRPLLIIAEDVEGEALSTLVVNKLRGGLKIAAVKAPGFGDRRKEMLGDIGILTNGQVISEETGIRLENIVLGMLGTAKRVIIDKDNTTIIDGAGTQQDIGDRVRQIRTLISDTTSDYDREKLEERLAKLAGGVAVIGVGASTETEMKEKKSRYEDALSATRAAVDEGIVVGGGVALLRASASISDLSLSPDQAFGAGIIERSLEAPIRAIVGNAGEEGAVVINKIREHEGNFGFNASTLEYGDLVDSGVIDPTKVVKSTIQNAASVASLLLTTEALITEADKDDDENE